MKKLLSVVLGAMLIAVSALSIVACGKSSGLSAIEALAEKGIYIDSVPSVFFDDGETSYVSDAIRTDELVFHSKDAVTVTVGSGSVTVGTAAQTSADGATQTTVPVTATAAGEYTLNFAKNGKQAGSLTLTARTAYPEDTKFDRLNVHDPSIIEVEENGKAVYYTFSTDNMGPKFGYQVRRSDDLVHWEYVGVAIEGYNENDRMPSKGNPVTGKNELAEVHELLSEDTNWDNVYTLWAPDVVKGADGKYWLYGCLTAAFGQGHSAIFLCKANQVTGPYKFDSILVYSYDGWTNGPNAIDPQIYYAGDKMFMAYGSFTGGIYSLELDPATGNRLKTDEYYKADWSKVKETDKADTAAARYGTKLVSTAATEGPTINYHEDVALYTGDPAAFDAGAVTYEDRYYLMGSAGSLSSTYNMRAFVGTLGEDGAVDFGSVYGSDGSRVSGSFSWKLSEEDGDIDFDFAYPGHNDTITTSDGVNLLAYHDRISFTSGGGNHYLMLSMYGFNSRGDLVMNPNRYAGEAERVVTGKELTELSGGKYSFAYVTDNNYDASYHGGYATDGLVFEPAQNSETSGTVLFGDVQIGTWTLYGDNWVYLDVTAAGAPFVGKFYGKAFPAYLESEGRGGLSMSFVSEDGFDTLYMNMSFAA